MLYKYRWIVNYFYRLYGQYGGVIIGCICGYGMMMYIQKKRLSLFEFRQIKKKVLIIVYRIWYNKKGFVKVEVEINEEKQIVFDRIYLYLINFVVRNQ